MEKTNTKILCITEKELKNPMIRRKIGELITLRFGFHSTEPYLPVSEAEVEILKDMPLFTKLKEYNNPKFPKEVGKYKSQRVVIDGDD